MTVKHALCIDASVAPFMHPFPYMAAVTPAIWAATTKLVDRAICETDESLLQLLPYMSLHHKGKVFVYSRGGAGGEGRLHGKLSIGIGGHVDEAPREGEDLETLLKREAAREYREEVGFDLQDDVYFSATLFDPTNPVGRVHLGLYARVACHSPTLSLEAGMIEKGEWVLPQELLRTEYHSRLEPWSVMVLQDLLYRDV